MDAVIKIAVIGIVGAVLTLLIKRTNPELSLVMSLAICGVILTIALKLYSAVTEVFSLVSASTGFSSAYIAPILKCVGIGITAKLGSELCRDAGQSAVAAAVEIAGAVCAIYVSLPLIKILLRIIGELA